MKFGMSILYTWFHLWIVGEKSQRNYTIIFNSHQKCGRKVAKFSTDVAWMSEWDRAWILIKKYVMCSTRIVNCNERNFINEKLCEWVSVACTILFMDRARRTWQRVVVKFRVNSTQCADIQNEQTKTKTNQPPEKRPQQAGRQAGIHNVHTDSMLGMW